MASNYYSIRNAGVLISDANEDVDPAATLPLTLLRAGCVPSPGPGQHPPTGSPPAPPYIEHDPDLVENVPMTPPPSYNEANLGSNISDFRSPSDAYDPPAPSLHHGVNLNDDDNRSSLLVGASEKQLCAPHKDEEGSPTDTMDGVLKPIPIYCNTIYTLSSKHLNFHVNPRDNNMRRWGTTDGPIPVSIDLVDFESDKQRLMVRACLQNVLELFNTCKVGPKFQFVDRPEHSAFYVRFGGLDDYYAISFFPGSPPKDWYIDVYKPGLELGETALIKILIHEMLHVLGVRHCTAHQEERDPCMRFPPDLSDADNWDPMMEPRLGVNYLTDHRWADQTLKTMGHLRQIYSMQEGSKIDGHGIRDVSWKDGANKRKRIAAGMARCLPN